MGAGKTSAAKHISSKFRLQYTRYSRVLEDWMAQDGTDRGKLQEIGWKVMDRGLQVELNSRLIGGLDLTRGAAIDGLRHPIDFDSLFAALHPSFKLIFLEAPPQKRFERLRSKFATFEAFEEADAQPVEGYIDFLKSLSSVTLVNDESLESLFAQLDAWMATLTGEPE
jgi:dephospho-CoA kinase